MAPNLDLPAEDSLLCSPTPFRRMFGTQSAPESPMSRAIFEPRPFMSEIALLDSVLADYQSGTEVPETNGNARTSDRSNSTLVNSDYSTSNRESHYEALDESVFISTKTALAQFLKSIAAMDSVYLVVDCDRPKRHTNIGTMAILAACQRSGKKSHAVVIDVYTLGSDTFTTRAEAGLPSSSLKSMLESPSILIYFWNSCASTETLEKQYGIHTRAVMDVQLMHNGVAYMEKRNGMPTAPEALSKVANMSQCIANDLHLDAERSELYARAKEAMAGGQKGGVSQSQVFYERPMMTIIVQYLLDRVTCLSNLHELYARIYKREPQLLVMLRRQSQLRAEQFKQTSPFTVVDECASPLNDSLFMKLELPTDGFMEESAPLPGMNGFPPRAMRQQNKNEKSQNYFPGQNALQVHQYGGHNQYFNGGNHQHLNGCSLLYDSAPYEQQQEAVYYLPEGQTFVEHQQYSEPQYHYPVYEQYYYQPEMEMPMVQEPMEAPADLPVEPEKVPLPETPKTAEHAKCFLNPEAKPFEMPCE